MLGYRFLSFKIGRFVKSEIMSVRAIAVHMSPVHSYFDEPVQVIVRGLLPKQTVNLIARVKDDKDIIFQGSAVHQATENGEVDLNCSPSLGGTYTGVEPMGLFWSLTPLASHQKLTRWDASRPLLVDIEVVSNERAGLVLAKETHQRRFMKEGVQRVVVTDGGLRGTLFIPPGDLYCDLYLIKIIINN